MTTPGAVPKQALPPADTDYFSLQLYVRVLAGSIAGVAGGLAMLATESGIYMLLGQSPLVPIRLVAVTLMGDSALLPSSVFWPILTGILVNAAMSAFFGGVFSTLLPPVEHRRSDVLWASLFSIAVALVMWFLVLPVGLNIALLVRMPLEVFMLGHVAFGCVLGLLLPGIEKRLMKREFEDRAPNIHMPDATETEEDVSARFRAG